MSKLNEHGFENQQNVRIFHYANPRFLGAYFDGKNWNPCFWDEKGNVQLQYGCNPNPKYNLKPINLLGTTDAQIWAKEFVRLIVNRGKIVDEGLMITWFANAIETGRESK